MVALIARLGVHMYSGNAGVTYLGKFKKDDNGVTAHQQMWKVLQDELGIMKKDCLGGRILQVNNVQKWVTSVGEPSCLSSMLEGGH